MSNWKKWQNIRYPSSWGRYYQQTLRQQKAAAEASAFRTITQAVRRAVNSAAEEAVIAQPTVLPAPTTCGYPGCDCDGTGWADACRVCSGQVAASSAEAACEAYGCLGCSSCCCVYGEDTLITPEAAASTVKADEGRASDSTKLFMGLRGKEYYSKCDCPPGALCEICSNLGWD